MFQVVKKNTLYWIDRVLIKLYPQSFIFNPNFVPSHMFKCFFTLPYVCSLCVQFIFQFSACSVQHLPKEMQRLAHYIRLNWFRAEKSVWLWLEENVLTALSFCDGVGSHWSGKTTNIAHLGSGYKGLMGKCITSLVPLFVLQR